ncbi:hypothetical protein [Aeromonas veronii]|uniref:Uncharacterized protein n=1 Tax=Aeromonas veronii TaxID=654 RepID=A0AAW5M5Z7_AERVE|nr:hypothetical protein [Aeromonas veronii]MCR4448993.1 hypothetical protein [Aeromonas veronii]MCR6551737.1 hypothetical protein [Aeromonas sp. CPF2-S1]
MGMRVGMAVVMRVDMIMMMVVGVIMVVLVRVIMTLCHHGGPHTVVVVMDISLMVIVVVNDQGARCALLMGMLVMSLMSMMMAVLMVMFMVLMIVGVGMVVFIFMAGDPRLTASAYATHINLPRCR